MTAPIRVRKVSEFGDWDADCLLCGVRLCTDDWHSALEFAHGHMAVAHQGWRPRLNMRDFWRQQVWPDVIAEPTC